MKSLWQIGRVNKWLKVVTWRYINPRVVLFFLFCIACHSGCQVKKSKIYQVHLVDHSEGLENLDWTSSIVLKDFTSPWSQASANTSFQALWDESNFYFKFEVREPRILIFREYDHEAEVAGSERVEIFFRQNQALDPYYCLEMDASGRVLDYRAAHYRQFDLAWDWPGDHLEIRAFIKNNGYVVTGKISLSSLNELGLLTNQTLQAGLYRGQCLSLDGEDPEFRWISWVDPKTSQPDFHVAGSFGTMVLTR